MTRWPDASSGRSGSFSKRRRSINLPRAYQSGMSARELGVQELARRSCLDLGQLLLPLHAFLDGAICRVQNAECRSAECRRRSQALPVNPVPGLRTSPPRKDPPVHCALTKRF